MNRKFFLIVTVLIILSLASCTRRRHRDNTRQTRSRKETPVKPVQPEPKKEIVVIKDTVVIVVPQPNVPTQPTVTPDEQEYIIVKPSEQFEPVVHKEGLPEPPGIIFQKPANMQTRQAFINNYNITGNMKELIMACDYDNNTVRNNAVILAGLSPGTFNLGQVCDIFDFCFTNWKYVNDPITIDYFSKASETLRNGLNGDCDDFAILMCSMILAIGGEARINFAQDSESGHAFSEVNIGQTNVESIKQYLAARYNNITIWYHDDDSGDKWINLDWQSHYPGGKYWEYNSGTSFNIIRNIYNNL